MNLAQEKRKRKEKKILTVAGLPMTSLSRETPDAAIWKRAVLGHVEDDAVRRPSHVVYSA